MSKANGHETATLAHEFENADIANIGDATGLRGSSTAGNFYVALFTGNPGETGSVAAECAYTSYARVAVARSSSNWTASSGSCSNDNAVTFPEATGGSETATHFAVCTAGTAGVANIIRYGALTSSLAISDNITPEFAAGALTFTED